MVKKKKTVKKEKGLFLGKEDIGSCFRATIYGSDICYKVLAVAKNNEIIIESILWRDEFSSLSIHYLVCPRRDKGISTEEYDMEKKKFMDITMDMNLKLIKNKKG